MLAAQVIYQTFAFRYHESCQIDEAQDAASLPLMLSSALAQAIRGSSSRYASVGMAKNDNILAIVYQRQQLLTDGGCIGAAVAFRRILGVEAG